MDFFRKMLSSISDTFFQNDLDDTSLYQQINTALQEERILWAEPSTFIDPYTIQSFREKWYSAYCMAKNETARLTFSLGLSGRKLRSVAPQFIYLYERLPVVLQEHNERIANQRASLAAKLILPVEGKQLDSQQMRCITKEVKNHLVLAGAGTGKTTTIVGYVKYLLKMGFCTPADILVLSFTNVSASEMCQRLHSEIGQPITAMTFHKLGLEIITSVQEKKPKINSSDIRRFVRHQLNNLVQDLDYLKKLSIYLTYNSVERKTEFDFKTMEEYCFR